MQKLAIWFDLYYITVSLIIEYMHNRKLSCISIMVIAMYINTYIATCMHAQKTNIANTLFLIVLYSYIYGVIM